MGGSASSIPRPDGLCMGRVDDHGAALLAGGRPQSGEFESRSRPNRHLSAPAPTPASSSNNAQDIRRVSKAKAAALRQRERGGIDAWRDEAWRTGGVGNEERPFMFESPPAENHGRRGTSSEGRGASSPQTDRSRSAPTPKVPPFSRNSSDGAGAGPEDIKNLRRHRAVSVPRSKATSARTFPFGLFEVPRESLCACTPLREPTARRPSSAI